VIIYLFGLRLIVLTFLLIYMRQSLSLLLQAKIVYYFDLSPYEIGILSLVCQSIPRSSLHNPFYKIWVITRSYIEFNFSLVLLNRFYYNSIRVGNLPNKISIVEELERQFEFGNPLQYQMFYFWYSLSKLCTLISLQIFLKFNFILWFEC
jgi:hypothetical protein